MTHEASTTLLIRHHNFNHDSVIIRRMILFQTNLCRTTRCCAYEQIVFTLRKKKQVSSFTKPKHDIL